MGFIERLGQDREERERREAQRLAKQLRKYEESKQQAAKEAERRWELRDQAQRYYQSSEFPHLLKQLSDITIGSIYDFSPPDFHRDRDKNPTSYYVTLVLSAYEDVLPLDIQALRLINWINKDSTYSIRHKWIDIESCFDGTIIVHGGRLGSTTLPLNRWNGRPDLQERALEKAYHHPQVKTVTDWSRPSGDSL